MKCLRCSGFGRIRDRETALGWLRALSIYRRSKRIGLRHRTGSIQQASWVKRVSEIQIEKRTHARRHHKRRYKTAVEAFAADNIYIFVAHADRGHGKQRELR